MSTYVNDFLFLYNNITFSYQTVLAVNNIYLN